MGVGRDIGLLACCLLACWLAGQLDPAGEVGAADGKRAASQVAQFLVLRLQPVQSVRAHRVPATVDFDIQPFSHPAIQPAMSSIQPSILLTRGARGLVRKGNVHEPRRQKASQRTMSDQPPVL
ncbi:hypothetical protein BKA56DRAFT_620554 [Ilyonectria sp. MPI-CAGE-AT-0026]|nr:hypothetical protein BKA56DRAFT_620554 [Ilyonectria sp. MPI-CAGE-AT-0026]